MKKLLVPFIILLSIASFAQENPSKFQLKTLSEQTIHVEAEDNKVIFTEHNESVVFLLFFGHNCKPCLKEIPTLKKLTDKKHQDLKILAIDSHGYNKEDLTEFQKEKEINYTLLTREDNKEFIAYIKAKTSWRGSLPFMIAFNKKGEVKLAHRGALSLGKLEAIYKAIKK